MSNPVLVTSRLSKHFGGVTATDDVSITVNKFETHAVIGPNGAGKTTLVSQISGSLKSDGGTICFNGQDITSMSVNRRALAGLARSFQITSLVMPMTVLDNVALAVQARSGHSFKFWKPARNIASIRQPAMQILETVGLAGRADHKVSSLSHGERRQVEIAVALATDPDLLLLDEPMAGMGTTESAAMVKLLKNLGKEKSILLVEHDMDAVFALADRISVLVYGRIIATGTPDEIRKDEAVLHAYLGEN